MLVFYKELVHRVAEWMVAWFVHGALNTDNISLSGESFDYGPFAFLDRWDSNFTAAYFDQSALYAFGRQPEICQYNLHLLQDPLAMLVPREPMEERLNSLVSIYQNHYKFCMYRRLGLPLLQNSRVNGPLTSKESDFEPIKRTLKLLETWSIEYGKFFRDFTEQIIKRGLPERPEN